MYQHCSSMLERLLLQTSNTCFVFNMERLWSACITDKLMQLCVAERKQATRKSALRHTRLWHKRITVLWSSVWTTLWVLKICERIAMVSEVCLHMPQAVTAKALQPMLQPSWLLLPSFPRSPSAALKTSTMPHVPSVPIYLTTTCYF